ncbi:hypothetical protein [Evtepia gabavorous]|uniref:hypothetical protein n=1 Tax=Evtepia gabavorous TaxID=2211183 RepID=UPI003A927540
MRMNFRTQMVVAVILVLAGFIVSFWTAEDLYYNLAWALTGLVFFINPVYPESIRNFEQAKAKKGIRIVGMILVFIGLTNGFGV